MVERERRRAQQESCPRSERFARRASDGRPGRARRKSVSCYVGGATEPASSLVARPAS